MEKFPPDVDVESIVKELFQGRELAKQLHTHLHAQSSSSSSSSRELLLQRVLYSYDQALSMLRNTCPSGGGGEAPPPKAMSDSPRSLTGSPHSDDSDQDQACTKRNKGGNRWSKKIKVSPEAGIEGQLDDGYGWRKYGQKHILGAKYPRGYYRCTYRHAQGCLATKQVQRSDDDPTMFEITYRRNHTCNPSDPQNPITQHPQNEAPSFNIQTSLRVITPQHLGIITHNPLGFPSSSRNNHFSYGDDDFLGNYISMNDGYGQLIPNFHNSGSELSPIVVPFTSTINFPTVAADFPFGPPGYDPNFTFPDN